VSDCNHNDITTLIIAADGCSLECEACHEIVLPVEMVSVIVGGDEIEWVE
jgi:hypothetical protein